MFAKPLIVLASASPRRRELLDQIGVAHRVAAADVDETPLPGEEPEHYVLRLAEAKSWQVWQTAGDALPVLAADTAVVVDGEILGKPRDREHALAMLRRLSGRGHRVLTGVSLRAQQHWRASSDTSVRFRPLSDAEILAYWDSGEPCDKAGAYAIQGRAALFVERIEGSFSGVVGLPLFESAELMRKAGIPLLGGAAAIAGSSHLPVREDGRNIMEPR
ncbi:Maf family protein [Methylogaea oryzae]|uniref:dTTP/UTP pyrophosphatase n=1 Tax=Methylogaea oryzae TaxID=1295382 RepID=A0A8D5AM04_9GAMM|nr:Maf family protein [Methylogaea oryzae]BBL72676.1 Maf-like protein [Methylogaea oryzae]